MKRLIMLLLAVSLAMAGCGGSSAAPTKPMPVSIDNLKAYAGVIEKLMNAHERKADETMVDLVKVGYGKAMEKMGYSFDETYRYLLVFNQMNGVTPASQLLWNAHEAISKNPDEALKKGVISQRTRDFIELGTTYSSADDAMMPALESINQCQNMSPDDYCNIKNLITLFRNDTSVRQMIPPEKWAQYSDGEVLGRGLMDGGFGTFETMKRGGMPIIDASGKQVKISQLGSKSPARFKVDLAWVANYSEYKKKLKEEQAYFQK